MENFDLVPVPKRRNQTPVSKQGQSSNPVLSPKPVKRRGRKPGIRCSILQRNAANARERSRMRVLSTAFMELKSVLPWVPRDTKLSKLDTLKLAAGYIAYLDHILSDSEPPLCSNYCSMAPIGNESLFRTILKRSVSRSKTNEFAEQTTSIAKRKPTVEYPSCQGRIDQSRPQSPDNWTRDAKAMCTYQQYPYIPTVHPLIDPINYSIPHISDPASKIKLSYSQTPESLSYLPVTSSNTPFVPSAFTTLQLNSIESKIDSSCTSPSFLYTYDHLHK
nr:transcription factor 21 [Hymenolepis microstoma]